MNYYIWEHFTNGSTKFFDCGIEEFEGWLDICWFTGEKIDQKKLPNPIIYNTDSSMNPEDFPLHSDSSFLVSDKILNILKALEIVGFDYYPAKIIKSKKKIYNNYYVLNILNVLDCLDKEKSKFKIKEFGPAKVYMFKKISFSEDKIPKDVKIFRINESTNVFINQEIRDAFINAVVTGAEFIPIEKGQSLFGNYEE